MAFFCCCVDGTVPYLVRFFEMKAVCSSDVDHLHPCVRPPHLPQMNLK